LEHLGFLIYLAKCHLTQVTLLGVIGSMCDTSSPKDSIQKNIDSKYMWKFLLVLMFMMFAFLIFRKQEKKKNPRSAASKQLIEKSDISDIFGEDLLDFIAEIPWKAH